MKNEKKVSEICNILRNLQNLELLLRVGLKRNSARNRVDLLAGCKRGDINKYAPLIQVMLRDHWPSGKFFACDDSVRFDLSTITGGVAIRDSTIIAKQIKGWIAGKNLSGQRRSWAAGYWLPEALCGDIATSEIIYDANGIGAQIKKLVVPYPPSLSDHIANICIDEIKQKIQAIERLSSKNSPIELELCRSDLTASMVRLAFARSRTYLRGFRLLNEQAKFLKPHDLTIYGLTVEISKNKEIRKLIEKVNMIL